VCAVNCSSLNTFELLLQIVKCTVDDDRPEALSPLLVYQQDTDSQLGIFLSMNVTDHVWTGTKSIFAVFRKNCVYFCR